VLVVGIVVVYGRGPMEPQRMRLCEHWRKLCDGSIC